MIGYDLSTHQSVGNKSEPNDDSRRGAERADLASANWRGIHDQIRPQQTEQSFAALMTNGVVLPSIRQGLISPLRAYEQRDRRDITECRFQRAS